MSADRVSAGGARESGAGVTGGGVTGGGVTGGGVTGAGVSGGGVTGAGVSSGGVAGGVDGGGGGIYDLVVVGGGAAGVAGALTAALAGLRVALVDSGARLGGQYFRHAATPAPAPGLDRFLRQARALGERADVLLRHQVWHISRDPDDTLTVHCAIRPAPGSAASRETSQDEPPATTGEMPVAPGKIAAPGERPLAAGEGTAVSRARAAVPGERAVVVRGRRLLIATGAYDRSLPFPGWDLPGVLTAGGAQALLKGNGVVAGRRIVVSGTGPFLLPVAAGLAEAGARVLGVYEANGGLGLVRHPLLALARAGEAAGYALTLARHRVPYLTRQAVVAAYGEHEVEAVTVARLDRRWNVLATRTIDCDTVAVGYGFVPQIELGVDLGCDVGHDLDGTPVLKVDHAQRTTVPAVWAAGEPTGVGGWRLAEVEGRLAARSIIAATHGAVTPAPGTAPARSAPPAGGAGAGVLGRRRKRWRAFAAALSRAYPVKPGWQGWLRDDTVVCRCEEVPLARVREAQRLGATDARSIKLLARPGMGWCQGRVCGYAVSCLAGETPHPPPRRPVAQPVTLGALSSLDPTEPMEDP
ncbi:MAG TPA: FAD/NAD(P)-binding oxidoreductase [Nonomuraea sp.]|nr:FAD/NAD(P)-binding oxidoreductase [Nonomuraea sp.]